MGQSIGQGHHQSEFIFLPVTIMDNGYFKGHIR